MHFASRLCAAASLAVVLLAGATAALGGTIRDDKVADTFYTNPTVDPAVGLINYTATDFCSGVLVAQDWVLTAKHCLTNNGSFVSFTAGNGVTYPIDLSKPFVAEPTGEDLALFHILPSTTTNALPPSAIVATRYRGTSELGNVTTNIGYGFGGTGTGGADAANFPRGVRRAGDNVVDRYAGFDVNNTFVTSTTDLGFTNFLYETFDSTTALQTPHEWCAATGDSGGGAFIDVGGAPQLAGITDALVSGTSKYGDATLSLRVTDYNTWIDTTVPEPSSLWLIPAAGALLVRRRAWSAC
jgi:hypothetical protein